MKVKMIPSINDLTGESGINRVVEAYYKYLPKYGVEIVEGDDHDLLAVHAGVTGANCDVCHCHGLYWTADYPATDEELWANKLLAAALRSAKQVTVPSDWVAQTLRRDMRMQPFVIGHGIDCDEWQPNKDHDGYVLWNKNRVVDVCNPMAVDFLSAKFADTLFVTTFTKSNRRNVKAVGVIPHSEMKRRVMRAGVYLSTTKETFGIGILEAMAAGVPVLGFAHGGILDLIEHCQSGYLAQPGNYEDLANGLDYCLKYRETLGANARDAARVFTWDRACQSVADVYRHALADTDPTASVVIPAYNYADKVGRAIESALEQDYDQLIDVIIVDDGSSDDLKSVVDVFAQRDSRVKFFRKENGGVATARNFGIARARGKYVCCLDADDAIESNFISTCVDALESDTSLSIAYTSLRFIKPDGSTGVSQWPGEYNFDKHLQKQNQIPTCCVFERKVWGRLGGYKQRYAPGGAGAEDAEFWLRAGACGFKAKKVTDDPLFVYSFQSGRVSGNGQYREVDWLAWHPWVRDGQHPFASVATPKNESHPVRQYDEPLVSVVVPVGPGHCDKVINTLDSLEAQTFRKWECVLVDDSGGGCSDLLAAYPYVKLVHCGNGSGASRARNVGVDNSTAPLILFVDADDWLYPDALQEMLSVHSESGAAVYTDYVGKANVDDPAKLAKDLRGRILHFDGKEAVIGYRAADYDCDLAHEQPSDNPYLWCNITTLFPKAWHYEIGGFDEAMPSWEDVDYWYRMAFAGKCFERIDKELLVYNFTTGTRRNSGLDKHSELIEYMRKKYAEVERMGCPGGCGKKRPKARTIKQGDSREKGNENMGRVLIKYTHPNRGQHPVTGAATKTRYGYHKLGDEFHVDEQDAAAQPHYFTVLRAAEPKQVAVAPKTVVAPPVLHKRDVYDLQSLPGVSAALAADLRARGIETIDDVLEIGEDGLKSYKGVGSRRSKMIIDAIKAMVA